jgi:hypothetical protein
MLLDATYEYEVNRPSVPKGLSSIGEQIVDDLTMHF